MSAEGPAIRVAVASLCGRLGVADLYVFGSRASEILARVRGEPACTAAPQRLVSDVDVGVTPLPGRRLSTDDLVELAQQLETLFRVSRVDVVLLPAAAPFLALDVIRGELLHCADPDNQAEHELYVLRRAGDLAPFQRSRQELALTRYAAGRRREAEP